MPNSKRRGLTLIEVVVVITIISILMTAVAVYAVGALSPARRSVAEQDIRTAMNALDLYKSMRGKYPTQGDGFRSLVEAHVLKVVPKDPWGGALGYALVDGEPVVTSLGADHAAGGTGDDEDVSSATLAAQ